LGDALGDTGDSSRECHGTPEAAGKVRHAPSGGRFHPWCGWLIDVSTLELRPHLTRARASAARDRRPRDRRAALAGRVALVQGLFRAARPRLHGAFLDPQINSGLTCRRNVLAAILHALLAARVDVRRGQAEPLVGALQQFLRCVAAYIRLQQRRALMSPPLGTASSTLIAGCEVDFLGWAALTALSHHRCATLGRAAMRQATRRRVREAGRRCARLSPLALPLLRLACDPKGLPRDVD
jgi:hypothetical protein